MNAKELDQVIGFGKPQSSHRLVEQGVVGSGSGAQQIAQDSIIFDGKDWIWVKVGCGERHVRCSIDRAEAGSLRY